MSAESLMRGRCSLRLATGVLTITAAGAIAARAATGILVALGADKDLAINFALASGLLLVTSATGAALACAAGSPVARTFARQARAARRMRLGAS